MGDLPIAPTLDQNFVKNIVYSTANKHGLSNEWVEQKYFFGLGNAYEVMARFSYAWSAQEQQR